MSEINVAQDFINRYKNKQLINTVNFEGDLMISESQLEIMLIKFKDECKANGVDKSTEKALHKQSVIKSWHFCPKCGIEWEKDSNIFGCWKCGYGSHVL